MNKAVIAAALLCAAQARAGELKFPRIEPRREKADYSFLQARLNAGSFSFDPVSRNSFQMDFRNCDLRGYDLSKNRQLSYASFNTGTKFPEKLPKGYSPAKVMELGRNPGLGVRRLHARGITGKGVGVGIVDQALLPGHVEYADRLRFYEEIHCLDDKASMHGGAVASLAVGRSLGVAPGADLYFIGQTNGETGKDGKFDYDLGYIAKSIDRLLEVNRALPADRKIRVISISLAMVEKWKGYGLAAAAIKRAAAEGVFVLTVGDRAYPLDGLGREPLADPDDRDSYTGCLMFCSNKGGSGPGELQVPMDSRSLADPNGDDSYYFARVGGQSWAVPWAAGLYALGCQVYPALTPDIFWREALASADAVRVKEGPGGYTLRKVANPARLIARLQALYGK